MYLLVLTHRITDAKIVGSYKTFDEARAKLDSMFPNIKVGDILCGCYQVVINTPNRLQFGFSENGKLDWFFHHRYEIAHLR